MPLAVLDYGYDFVDLLQVFQPIEGFFSACGDKGFVNSLFVRWVVVFWKSAGIGIEHLMLIIEDEHRISA